MDKAINMGDWKMQIEVLRVDFLLNLIALEWAKIWMEIDKKGKLERVVYGTLLWCKERIFSKNG